MKKNNLLLTSICSFLLLLTIPAEAQIEAYKTGFFYFDREPVAEENNGAGYSFYVGVWPIMQQYPGPQAFQVGLPSTWLRPFFEEEPDDFYNTIEGGLGWWHDTRFGTETPKFIMGGVAYNFNQWANGTGAGSGDLLDDGHRDWNDPSGKYGVAQLSSRLLWPPDGLNMEQGANGELLGYGYHPLPLTDPLPQTNGTSFSTGNQCWTLFLNTTNFKGPATFFVPTFWTETVLNDLSLEGLFFDTNSSDKNPAFAMEYAESPALVGVSNSADYFARMFPMVFPKTSANQSEVIRDIKVYTKDAKWDEVENWFNGGAVPSTEFEISESENLLFDVDPFLFGAIGTEDDNNPFEADMNYPYAEKIMSADRKIAGFQWDTNVVQEINNSFILPEYYKLNINNVWDYASMSDIPSETELLTNEPNTSPRNDDTPYLTPIEPDCHLQDPNSPWNSPGPSAGPFAVDLGDGSRLTYYWYRFIDQPSIVYANLPETVRQNLQDRVENIHTHWNHTDEYLPSPGGGTLVGLDPGLIVTPPAGMEVGYVPIVTRQEKITTTTSVSSIDPIDQVSIYPNPTKGQVNVSSTENFISEIKLFNAQGILIASWTGLQKNWELSIGNYANGIYFLAVTGQNKITYVKRIVKGE